MSHKARCTARGTDQTFEQLMDIASRKGQKQEGCRPGSTLGAPRRCREGSVISILSYLVTLHDSPWPVVGRSRIDSFFHATTSADSGFHLMHMPNYLLCVLLADCSGQRSKRKLHASIFSSVLGVPWISGYSSDQSYRAPGVPL